MHRAGRRASKVNGCRKIHTSAQKKKRRSSERRDKDWSGHKGLMDALRAPLPLGLKPSGEFLKTAHWAVFLTEFHLIGSSPAPCSKNGKRRLSPLSHIRPKGSERKPGATDCPAVWPSVLRYAPSHAQGARWGARLPRSVRSPQMKKRRSSERRNKDWSGQRGSNPRPPPWQGGALPTEPCPQIWRREPDSNRW